MAACHKLHGTRATAVLLCVARAGLLRVGGIVWPGRACSFVTYCSADLGGVANSQLIQATATMQAMVEEQLRLQNTMQTLEDMDNQRVLYFSAWTK